MRPAARFIAAGVVAAALGVAPGFAQGQTPDPSSPSSPGTSTGSTESQPPTGTTQSPSSSASASGGVDENAARDHLTQARQALADLTKLPAAAQLQGDQRTAVSNLIQAFNGLATATGDWRPKFKDVSDQLDAILGTDTAGATGTAGAATSDTPSTSTGTPSTSTGTPSDSSTPGAATGAAGASGSYDASIISKLRELRTHLDAFREASGDPTAHFDAIDEIVNQALSGSAGASSVGTTGSTSTSADAGGTVSISRAQLEEIREHVAKLRAASEAAAARRQ